MTKLLRKFTAVILVLLSVTITFSSVSALTNDSKDSLPESYSSVEQGYITSVKDQGNTATCKITAMSTMIR